MKKFFSLFLIFSYLIAVDYESEIQPIWNSNCTNCHGYPNQYGNLVLFSYDDLMNSGTVVPGDASSSSLYDRITRAESQNGDMPPTGSLLQSEIDLIAAWINEGALEEESSDIVGCMDPDAITCDDAIDTLYFPECATCSNGSPCDNYYNPNATVDNGLCMYNDVPSDNQFTISAVSNGFDLDWSNFTPPVDINQYVLQRCVDFDGDSDGDGVLEYDICVMLLSPATFSQDTSYFDEYVLGENEYMKYSLYVHYPNNNYWGSAFGSYYYDPVLMGDLNFDGVINVIDVVTLVNAILGTTLSSEQQIAADLNGDGVLNVIDIVSIVNIIVG